MNASKAQSNAIVTATVSARELSLAQRKAINEQDDELAWDALEMEAERELLHSSAQAEIEAEQIIMEKEAQLIYRKYRGRSKRI